METTSPKFFCFVLMPFSNDFDDIYQYGIKESCKSAGAYCERVDEQIFQERILDRIYNQIAKADLVIADMTGRNPNVFYEVGYAHALNKPTVLLTQNSDDIPFDLKHFPHIIYENKIATIRAELTKKVEWFKNNVHGENVSYKNDIEIYIDDHNLASGEVIHEYERGHYPNFSFTVYNGSPFTYQTGEFQIGVISKEYNYARNEGVKTTRLPDKTYLHMLPFFGSLFPGAYTSYDLLFSNNSQNPCYDSMLTIKVFTDLGSRDFKLRLKQKDLSPPLTEI